MEDLLPRPSQTTAQRPAGVPVIPPEFIDDADKAGLHFVHENGHKVKNIPPTQWMCGGVGLLDYDGDGWLDVYAVQGGAFPPADSASRHGDRLFRNRGDGTFEDVTERAGIASFPAGYGHGVTVGDYDNDGRPDLFVTRWHSYALYRNQGDGRFEDVTDELGWAAIATGRRRRRLPTWTATAIWISTCAIISCSIPPVRKLCPPPIRRAITRACRAIFRRCRITCSATMAGGLST